VTFWAEVFLGVIAVATLASAIMQIATLVGAAVLARRLAHLVEDVERQLRPTLLHIESVGRDAARASALAVAQVERADEMLAGFAARVDETLDDLQGSLSIPGREARALLSGLRAALLSLRELRTEGRRRGRAEGDDALFI
jgi:hypothetical protein